VAWGLSDFLGGWWSRRNGAWITAVAVQVGSIATTVVAWMFLGGPLTPRDVLWAVLAGIGMGAGTGLLYRGLAKGAMGVVAPISALSAAVVPLTVGLLLGERPGLWAVLGIGAALPAIWLVSSDPEERAGRILSRDGALDGLLSGAGFGVAFVGLDQMTRASELTPVMIMQLVSIVPILLIARVSGEAAIPRSGSAWSAVWIGPLGAGANVAFMRAAQLGELTITSVLASLYPAITVLLAVLVLRERVRPTQAAGLALAALAVILISRP
jgi:drug/metabolite transporter (DMT)-like permease